MDPPIILMAYPNNGFSPFLSMSWLRLPDTPGTRFNKEATITYAG
jgi:hypothetical protein